ncbi:flavinoxidoreductase/NADHoxidase [Moniliophthora roreri]|uniref:NADH:flavin oxidoreductase/NADH oxidase N-terminal domain-containing protein n=1 Tax=Moniliophthora roreri TaxID=221103 RepID=A0A0W0FDY8_MONRR|nr:flavinoxidoreductase/NADHoxidase [Moniliophthora roreri]
MSSLFQESASKPNPVLVDKPTLFQPVRIGYVDLRHRVVLAPLTRYKSEKMSHVPLMPIMKDYYTQRATFPGTLLITEATFIAAKAGGYPHVPGIWSDEQIEAWKEARSYIYLQLWVLGRAASPDHLKSEDPSFDLVSASDIRLSDRSKDEPAPRPLTVEEIHEYAELYGKAAANAVHKAGFDGVEIHGANGYLIDQFLQDVSNKRTDEYGGSVENRCRFALQVVKKVTEAVGVERTGIRMGPWTEFQDMGMENPKPTFSYLISQLKENYPKMSYIHVVEPRIKGDDSVEHCHEAASNDFLRDIWAPRPYISAGGYTREKAFEQAEKGVSERKGPELIAFGRYFLANPDLPLRVEKGIEFNEYNRETFYLMGDTSGKGYTDYPFALPAGVDKVLD